MRRLLFASLVLLMAVVRVPAAEVVLENAGLDLLANLELADGKSLKGDGAALITHGTLAHNGMEIIATLQKGLKQRGISSLAITLSLGLDKRKGMYDCALEHDHRHSDGVDEIGAWVQWLKAQGASKVSLVGHSRGGNQTAIYASETPDAIVDQIALIAPPTASAEDVAAQYQAQFKTELAPLLERAKQLADRDEGDTVLDGVGFLSCPAARVTAAAFLDYYGPDARRNTPGLIEKINRPLLVVVGDADTVVPGLKPAMAKLSLPANVAFRVIAGADHFFRDLAADDLADELAKFLAAASSGPK